MACWVRELSRVVGSNFHIQYRFDQKDYHSEQSRPLTAHLGWEKIELFLESVHFTEVSLAKVSQSGWDTIRWVTLKEPAGVAGRIFWGGLPSALGNNRGNRYIIALKCMQATERLCFIFYKKSQLFHSVIQVPMLESTCPKVGIIFPLFAHPTHLLQPIAPPCIPCLVNDITCCPN